MIKNIKQKNIINRFKHQQITFVHHLAYSLKILNMIYYYVLFVKLLLSKDSNVCSAIIRKDQDRIDNS